MPAEPAAEPTAERTAQAARSTDATRPTDSTGPTESAPAGTAEPTTAPATAPRTVYGSPGELVAGRYRIGPRLGSGSSGVVHRAHDRLLGREVALKELRAPGNPPADELAALHARVRQEVRCAARLSHPGIIAVHDVVQHGDRPWVVMELIDGFSLGDLLRAGALLDPVEAARVGLELVDALRTAHRAGVLHRALTPSNVLLGPGGRVVLTDFGTALLHDTDRPPRSGELSPAPEHLAPERVRGLHTGPEADLWALGVTLYHVVEGVSPFRRSSSVASMQAVLTDEPPTPVRAGALGPTLTALLAKEPADRLSLEQALGRLSVVAEPLLRTHLFAPPTAAASPTEQTGGAGADAPTTTPAAGRTPAAQDPPGAAEAPGAAGGSAVPGTLGTLGGRVAPGAAPAAAASVAAPEPGAAAGAAVRAAGERPDAGGADERRNGAVVAEPACGFETRRSRRAEHWGSNVFPAVAALAGAVAAGVTAYVLLAGRVPPVEPPAGSLPVGEATTTPPSPRGASAEGGPNPAGTDATPDGTRHWADPAAAVSSG
ncbi:serine/threonine-protein kinase [Allostreptomyces psammosilenae]|uniref:non-specific serine/threonine protein kinase n=1 Tax=Allostreptomyces psammosilenae TaxID=1892865 RepID=A0A852ZUA1_9ACTN|nr:serine/threonine-protein kinase [Allostreptomyces psammosilenae]NYI05973.1 hypothetical protein [Allostreptomyces psammosilenae]